MFPPIRLCTECNIRMRFRPPDSCLILILKLTSAELNGTSLLILGYVAPIRPCTNHFCPLSGYAEHTANEYYIPAIHPIGTVRLSVKLQHVNINSGSES